jgi:hypothetical protein
MATHVVKTDYLDVPTDTHTINEVPVRTMSKEYHEGDEVDLSQMDQERVKELEEAGAIVDISTAKKQQKAEEEAQKLEKEAQDSQAKAREAQLKAATTREGATKDDETPDQPDHHNQHNQHEGRNR